MTAVQSDHLLASDAEREQTVERLDTAFTDGRLGVEEFGERVTAVLTRCLCCGPADT
ncbi:MAG: DUF1707 domain-containing protein [Propionibacteriales bacterium]|nr:DUF1707 domain-containing protein [Propionibacteriales bacterium]